MYVDIHAHLDLVKNLDKVIQRAKSKGITKIITSGLETTTNKKALEIANKYDIVQASLSLFPRSVLRSENFKHWDYDIESEKEFIIQNKNKIVAIGETGLDYHWTGKKQEQIELFNKVIELSEDLNKPLIVHCRDAEKDVFEILKTTSKKDIVIHCYTGPLKLALDTNYFFSIPPAIVRMKNFQELARNIPLNKLLTETDSPFQSPLKHLRNEPCFVPKTIAKISELKKVDLERLRKVIYYNAIKLF